MSEIAIFGAGAWGTALALAWARAGRNLLLWDQDQGGLERMARSRIHPLYSDRPLPWNIHLTQQMERAMDCPIWVSALSAQASPNAWKQLLRGWKTRPRHFIHVSKGILQGSHQRLSEALEPILGFPVGVLSGPTFASEVARECPSAIVLALPLEVFETEARELQAFLATDRLRVYLSRDVLGVELCGALKNVLAIAAGYVDGLGLGYNATAALITRGLAELSRLVVALGGQMETVMGLAGMGDLLLTATGPQSRNRRLGQKLAQGLNAEAAAACMGGQVVEGIPTTAAALALARTFDVELPITEEVQRILTGATPQDVIHRLMGRSLKSE